MDELKKRMDELEKGIQKASEEISEMIAKTKLLMELMNVISNKL